ncbi:MAG: polyprenyl synthetase family protein [Candidatus Marinimicrobia bacterium]|nr:polyprenyl synthetase family protein [Candidatus Neomarinimicrobiota bacterium]MBT3630039.1 polyprenyl synthetase family protein [Candidatus Neomarinimicrobiota bacterium]MBT3823848.1 polyprenyl synthetase family protein [Candidatus Neomarinimicrobiota bacterium]MBT4130139.1 polyprenyl synthetase family protein [Candidatus Neomarinimicrobiota bacterium]MBT4295512.1 polyprenyl synthetase family protein [Candidatus Neomarinimicrobiota bacterium]
MKISLDDLLRPIQAELNSFQHYFENALKSHVFLINQVMKYVIAQKGKKMRPMLLLLSAKLSGDCTEQTYSAATLVEVLHTATLVHDDVVDEAETRRGLPSINSIWRNKVSVLIGDYLFSKALVKMVALKHPEMLELLAHTADKLVTGEIDQIDRARSDTMTEDAYYAMIEDKTASLLATGCKLGAMTTSNDKKVWDALYEYGRNFGIAFQIKDDLFDFEGRASSVGKPIGLDVKHNMVTLPIIHALQQCGKSEQREFKRMLKRGTDKVIQQNVLEFINRYGGLEYTKQRLQDYSDKAKASLEGFPDSPIKYSMIQFIDFNIQREK